MSFSSSASSSSSSSSTSSASLSTANSNIDTKKEDDATHTPSPGHELTFALTSSCALLIGELTARPDVFLDSDRKCIECHGSISSHSRTAEPPSSSPTSSHTSSSYVAKLDKGVLSAVPVWRKPHKATVSFFNTLERTFMTHGVTDESLFKRYLQHSLSLSDLSGSEQQYAADHITNVITLSWAEVKVLFAKRYEQRDHTRALKQQFLNIKYHTSDTIQSFSQRYINLCDECEYNPDDRVNIDKFIDLLPTDMQRRFGTQCHLQRTPLVSFGTLQSIVDTITEAEFVHNNVTHFTSDNTSLSSSTSSSHAPRATHGAHKSVSFASSRTMHPSSSPSTPAKSCVYHPTSTTHNTTECSIYKAKHATTFSGDTRSALSHSSSSNPSTPVRPTVITCFNCGKVGHKSPECTAPRAPSKPPAAPSSHFVPSNTRTGTTFSAYHKPAPPSMKTVSYTHLTLPTKRIV